MTTTNSTYNTREGKIDQKVVRDPRIESPDVKVIYPEELSSNEVVTEQPETPSKVNSENTEIKKMSVEDKTYDQGFLDEVEIVASKSEVKGTDTCDCEIGFVKAFKQNWILISSIALGLGVVGFIIGRITKKVS